MTFLRVKPVRKTNGKNSPSIYHYVYEVESYKDNGKVKQKTLRLLGRYIKFEKKKNENFPINKALSCDSKEQLFKEIFAVNLRNYGFAQEENREILSNGNVVADLGRCRVFDSTSGKDIYVNINEKFFGTSTLKKLLKPDNGDVFGFVKAIIDSGAVGIEFSEFRQHEKGSKTSHDFKLLQIILDKFSRCLDASKLKEMSFEDFARKVGY